MKPERRTDKDSLDLQKCVITAGSEVLESEIEALNGKCGSSGTACVKQKFYSGETRDLSAEVESI